MPRRQAEFVEAEHEAVKHCFSKGKCRLGEQSPIKNACFN